MRRGLTALEVLLVLSITGGVLSVATYTVVDYSRAERDAEARAQVQEVRGTIEAEHIISGTLPKTLGHADLATSRDPWGNTLAYVQCNGGTFELFSRGPDGIPRTPDDIHAAGLEPVIRR